MSDDDERPTPATTPAGSPTATPGGPLSGPPATGSPEDEPGEDLAQRDDEQP